MSTTRRYLPAFSREPARPVAGLGLGLGIDVRLPKIWTLDHALEVYAMTNRPYKQIVPHMEEMASQATKDWLYECALLYSEDGVLNLETESIVASMALKMMAKISFERREMILHAGLTGEKMKLEEKWCQRRARQIDFYVRGYMDSLWHGGRAPRRH